MSIALTATVIFILLTVMYTYMYKRLQRMSSDYKNGTYAPDMKVSGVELLVFFLIYYIGAMLSLDYEKYPVGTFVSALIALFLSFLVINKFTYDTLKIGSLIAAIVIMSSYYGLLIYFSTML